MGKCIHGPCGDCEHYEGVGICLYYEEPVDERTRRREDGTIERRNLLNMKISLVTTTMTIAAATTMDTIITIMMMTTMTIGMTMTTTIDS